MNQRVDTSAEIGLKIRRKMFGKEPTDSQVNANEPMSKRLQEIVTESCFGATWSRSALSMRDRSLITVAMLTALGHSHELRIHIRGALENGVTPDEIREVAIHSYLYAGLPVAFGCAKAAEEVLTEEEKGMLS